MRKREWLPTPLAQPKNCFGHAPIERRWHIKARLADGFVRWHGVFDDREDADAFLWAAVSGSLNQEPDLWRLPFPAYCPDYGEGAAFVFAASITITASGSQSVPGDWNDGANSIHAIGGGGSGPCGSSQNANRGCGGSGAEYRVLTNYAASGTFTYTIGAGGTGPTRSTAGVTAGNDGNDTILDTTALIAKKGLGGTILNGSTPTAPAGGTGGTGGTGSNGGAGGATGGFNDIVTGGGGAGGPSGAGAAGSTGTANNNAPGGGQGGNGSGGTGGGGSGASSSASLLVANSGNSGSDITTGVGAGGGGGGCVNASSGGATGGAGGNYGAGGGGGNAKGSGTGTGGAGKQGVIYMTYTPLSRIFNFNMPMLGM